MASRTMLASDDLLDIGRQFELNVKNPELLKGGLRNSNYRSHANGKTYVFRVCDDQTPEQAGKLVRLMSYMHENGVPCPKPVFCDGERSVIMYHDKPVVVLNYIDGETVSDLSKEQLGQLGACMAKMHNLKPPDYIPRSHPFGFETYQERFSGIKHSYTDWFKRQKECFDDALPADLPKGLLHGDLWFDNAIYDGENLAGIIDFESAFGGNRVFDLGQTSIGACRDNGSLNCTKVKALVDGYERVRPLEQQEKESLKMASSHAAAITSIWRFYHFNVMGNEPEHQKYFEAVQLSDRLNALPNDRFMEAVFGGSYYDQSNCI